MIVYNNKLNMRLILITICFLVSITICNNINSKEPCLKIQINNIIKIDTISDSTQRRFYSANIDLVNNTDTLIGFWIFTCSWQWNFLTNKSEIYLDYHGCDQNSASIRKIEPNQKLTYNAVFVLSDTIKAINNFKLGFILIKEKEIKAIPGSGKAFFDLLKSKREKKKDIIWSEKINFNH